MAVWFVLCAACCCLLLHCPRAVGAEAMATPAPPLWLGQPSWVALIVLAMVVHFGKTFFIEATYFNFMLARKVAKEEISRAWAASPPPTTPRPAAYTRCVRARAHVRATVGS